LISQGVERRITTEEFKNHVKEKYLRLRKVFQKNPEQIENELNKNDAKTAKLGLHRLDRNLKGKIAVDIPDPERKRGALRLVLKKDTLELVAVSNHYKDLKGLIISFLKRF
jgi:hypothetical protein